MHAAAACCALESISGTNVALLLRQQRLQVAHQHLANQLALADTIRPCVVMKISLVALSASATATATLSELTR